MSQNHALLITQCPDPMRWYADMIGRQVPLLGKPFPIYGEYKSREPAGFTNFVRAEDCKIVSTVVTIGGEEYTAEEIAELAAEIEQNSSGCEITDIRIW